MTSHSSLNPSEPSNFVVEYFTSCGWKQKKPKERKVLEPGVPYSEIETEPDIFKLN